MAKKYTTANTLFGKNWKTNRAVQSAPKIFSPFELGTDLGKTITDTIMGKQSQLDTQGAPRKNFEALTGQSRDAFIGGMSAPIGVTRQAPQPMVQPQQAPQMQAPMSNYEQYSTPQYNYGGYSSYSMQQPQEPMQSGMSNGDLEYRIAQLGDLRASVLAGLPVDYEAATKILTGMDAMELSPQQQNAVRDEVANGFENSMSYVEQQLAERRAAEKSAQSSGGNIFGSSSYGSYGSYGGQPGGNSGMVSNIARALMYKDAKSDKEMLQQAMQAGDTNDVKMFLKSAVSQSIGKDLNAREQTLSSLDSLIKAYDILEKNGVKLGIFGGTIENLANKIGKTTAPNGDIILAQQLLNTALGPYRQQQTGAAWGEQEAKEYNDLFGKRTDDLALAKQKALNLKNILESKNKLDINMATVDGAYDYLYGNGQASGQQGYGGYQGQSNIPQGFEESPEFPGFYVGPDGKYYPESELPKVTRGASTPQGSGGAMNQGRPIGSLSEFKERIARNESGGNYGAVGPRVPSGPYKGQVALGKYQVMEGNVTPWARQYLGINITPQQFYNDPGLQEALMDAKFQDDYKKHGNWQNVASVHFTGQPFNAKSAQKRDVNITNQEYIRRLMK